MCAHVRVMTRTGTWIVSMLDNGRKLMCIEFGLICDEWLCRYGWWSEITKWRLDDVMVGWSGWKGYCIHSASGQSYCENLKMIAHSVFEISSTQNLYREGEKIIQTSLRAISRRPRDRMGRNLVSEYFEMTCWIENLTICCRHPIQNWRSLYQ